MLKSVLITSLFIEFLTFGQFIQKGQTLTGTSNNDNCGYSVAINQTGDKVVTGIHNGVEGGSVKVYSYNGTLWTQIGSTLYGAEYNDSYGTKVAINTIGDIIAVSVPGADPNGSSSGIVKIYEWDGSDWIQKGNDIEGQNTNEYTGQALSLNGNGNIVVIGINGNTGANDAGRCRIYEWNGSDWIQKGLDIQGESVNDLFGTSVDINYEGNIVAVGAIENDGNGNESGHVRVFEWLDTYWSQVGGDIDGEMAAEYSGSSVALDSTGTTVAIGSPFYSGLFPTSGSVRVFEWSDAQWTLKGSLIEGQGNWAHFGRSTRLSNSGNILVVGSPDYDATGIGGRIAAYYWNNNEWQLIDNYLEGAQSAGWFGHEVDIAETGSNINIAVGIPYGGNSGEVKIYHMDYGLSLPEETHGSFVYPNPSNGSFCLQTVKDVIVENIHIYSSLGESIEFSTLEISSNNVAIEISGDPGVYFMTYKSDQLISTTKIFVSN
ncbi:MAG: T9SS type A sorting domain-containing protein [Crocinitomicaceae bacterium]|nr:T9SS type A sorting domain-containing protein [Crocinitomicaceae bacterium]